MRFFFQDNAIRKKKKKCEVGELLTAVIQRAHLCSVAPWKQDPTPRAQPRGGSCAGYDVGGRAVETSRPPIAPPNCCLVWAIFLLINAFAQIMNREIKCICLC